MKIAYRIDSRDAQVAFSRLPEAMRRHVNGALQRGAGEIASEAKLLAPKLFSALSNSIDVFPVGDLAYEVRPGVAYAAYVEGGSGPAAGHARYYPNPDNLLQYLMTSPKARGFSRWKRSEKGRIEQEMGLVRRAQAFAWWIYQHGTKAQPFMRPAAEKKADACLQFVANSVGQGLREVFGG